MDIRPERVDDSADIGDVIVRVFGRADEARLVAQLRGGRRGDFAGCGRGQDCDRPHPVVCDAAPFRALALAPLAVAPE